ncbi:hypothetical protein JB92DRAFT_2827950 [Gautieria morchelliformis]|nr:hypothetical protein JB92DRAFT_2827950 [Gautieria morchelliformis]
MDVDMDVKKVIKFFMGPLGAYSPHYGSIEKCKYRMTCAAPDDKTLSDIFQRGVEIFKMLQDSIAKTSNHQFLLDSKQNEDRIIDVPIMPHTYLEDLVQNKNSETVFDDDQADSKSKLDDIMKNYPVPSEYKEQFDAITPSYSVNELPIYHKNKFVPPHSTTKKLENAVVELHVAITHNYMRRDCDKFDSFNANIREIFVLIPGSPKSLSPYKRKNPRDGPLLPHPSTSTSEDDVEEGPSKKTARRSKDVD